MVHRRCDHEHRAEQGQSKSFDFYVSSLTIYYLGKLQQDEIRPNYVEVLVF